jgi:hypothetical protein
MSLVAITFYFIFYQPAIGLIIGYILAGIVFLFLIYVIFAPLFDFIGERAEDIIAVYTDAFGKGLHVFSSFNTSRIKQGLSPLTTIQYWFFISETGKNYYTTLFTYTREPVAGSANYIDFNSFEEDVLPSSELKTAQENFSRKLGWDIQLGKRSREGENENYETVIGSYTFKVEPRQGLIRDKLVLCCYERDRKVWQKKL